MKTDNSCELLSPYAMAKIAEQVAIYKATKKTIKTLYSAIMAGMFISIAFAFYITVTTGTSTVPFGFSKLVGGICFSLGLILCVICGADLFTSTVLLIVAKATKAITWRQMLSNWAIVYIGNFIGALLFVAIIWLAGEHRVANGLWGVNVLQVSSHKLHHTFTQAVFLGILANLMVCLATWMSYAGRTLIDKAFIMILPVAMFVAGGFEHSIANMFMVPMGIVIKTFANSEFWNMISLDAGQFSILSMKNFFIYNLIPVTIGNIMGGSLLVGLTYWVIYLRDEHH